jgi:hypothetical protein
MMSVSRQILCTAVAMGILFLLSASVDSLSSYGGRSFGAALERQGSLLRAFWYAALALAFLFFLVLRWALTTYPLRSELTAFFAGATAAGAAVIALAAWNVATASLTGTTLFRSPQAGALSIAGALLFVGISAILALALAPRGHGRGAPAA